MPGPRTIPSVRRHARPALLAFVLASGVGFARPADVAREVTDAPAAPAAVASAPATAATVLGPLSPTNPPGAVASTAPPSLATGAGTGLSPSFDPGGIASLPATRLPADLPPSRARSHAQTWEPPADPANLTGYVWPLQGRITDVFGPSPWGEDLVNGSSFHDGLDIATFCGDRIVAARSGTVLAAGRHFDREIGWVGDLGPYFARLDANKIWWTLPIAVVVDDGNGYRSVYAHFWQVVVKPGQHVRAGQLIGYEGATGLASGCHLHYGLFAPHETATFAILPAVVKRMLVPAFQIARIDPLRVLPARHGTSNPVAAPGATGPPVAAEIGAR